MGINPKLLYCWQQQVVAEVGSVEVTRDPEVRALCYVLRVTTSAYYAWRTKTRRLTPVPAWQVAVRQLFVRHARCYGTRRLRAELAAQGYTEIAPITPTPNPFDVGSKLNCSTAAAPLV